MIDGLEAGYRRLQAAIEGIVALICLVGVGAALPALAEQRCANPTISAPAHESTESSVRPTISWPAVAGASGYRLKLVSREPEGRTFATIDTLVKDTHFVPPQALSDGFARVKATVTSQCPVGTPSAPTPGREHHFLIDGRSACTLSSLTLDPREGLIRWAPTTGADGYEVFGYDPVDGKLLFKLATRAPTAVTAVRTTIPVVVAVRARCGEVFGQLGYLAY